MGGSRSGDKEKKIKKQCEKIAKNIKSEFIEERGRALKSRRP